MKSYIYIILIVVLTSCRTSSEDKNKADDDTAEISITNSVNTTSEVENIEAADTTDYNNATYFIIVADTNQDYSILHKKMFDLNSKLKISIDTLGRFYNRTKNLIALPDNDKDEIYAGEYFPRRFPSENMSLEYLKFYQKQAGAKTIALVTGIYETEKSADSALIILQKTNKKTFKIKATIYVGCIH